MSDSNTGRNDKNHVSARKRSLPSWMCSGEEDNDEDKKSEQPGNCGKSKKDQSDTKVKRKDGKNSAPVMSLDLLDFSKLVEGVVLVLSGFVNPERGILRSQMLEMGAEYQPDWSSTSTLLVCAFPDTPKFRQVESDGGTIISKDWISLCYNERKLIDIEPYLLNAGKPWRRPSVPSEANKDIKPSVSMKSLKHEEKGSHSKKSNASSKMKDCFSPSKVKKLAADDFKRTVTWLQNQDEKPDPSEINNIAAEGILACLQDVIDALKQGRDIQTISEQWACTPQCVTELQQFEDTDKNKVPLSKEDLCRQAILCKQIYELEFLNMEPATSVKKNIIKSNLARGDANYDSDETIEMTEEEINEAYNSITSTL